MNIDSIKNGYVIDHIQAGKSLEIYNYLKRYNKNRRKNRYKLRYIRIFRFKYNNKCNKRWKTLKKIPSKTSRQTN